MLHVAQAAPLHVLDAQVPRRSHLTQSQLISNRAHPILDVRQIPSSAPGWIGEDSRGLFLSLKEADMIDKVRCELHHKPRFAVFFFFFFVTDVNSEVNHSVQNSSNMSAEPTLTNGQSNQAAQQVSPRPPKTPAVITSQPSLGAAPDQQPPKSTGSTSHPTCSDAIPAIAPSPTLESDRGSQSHASPTTTLDPRAEEAVTQADIRRESHGSDAGKSPSAHVVPVESPLGEEAPEQRAKPAWRKWLAEICYCVISLLSLISAMIPGFSPTYVDHVQYLKVC